MEKLIFLFMGGLFLILDFGGFDGCMSFVMPSDRKVKEEKRKQIKAMV